MEFQHQYNRRQQGEEDGGCYSSEYIFIVSILLRPEEKFWTCPETAALLMILVRQYHIFRFQKLSRWNRWFKSCFPIQVTEYEVKISEQAAKFDLSALPEAERRLMKKLTSKNLEKEEYVELSSIISGVI